MPATASPSCWYLQEHYIYKWNTLHISFHRRLFELNRAHLFFYFTSRSKRIPLLCLDKIIPFPIMDFNMELAVKEHSSTQKPRRQGPEGLIWKSVWWMAEQLRPKGVGAHGNPAMQWSVLTNHLICTFYSLRKGRKDPMCRFPQATLCKLQYWPIVMGSIEIWTLLLFCR